VTVRERLAVLGLHLPEPPAPRREYVAAVVHGGLAYVSGQVSREGQQVITGPVTPDTPPAVLVHAARACVLRALSVLEQAIGCLDRVDRILFLRGFVHGGPGFQNHSQVLDEASRLLLSIYGDRGRHARSAVGVAGLPGGGMLEIGVPVATEPKVRFSETP